MTDWSKITLDLRTKLGSAAAVGSIVGCSKSAINELISGRTSEPVHSTGESLIALHKRLFK